MWWRHVGEGAVGRVSPRHRLYGDSWEVGGGTSVNSSFLWGFMYCDGSKWNSRSCGSAVLICGSGLLLGERAVTATAACPLQLPAEHLVAYWPRSRTAMFLCIRRHGFPLMSRNHLSCLWSPISDATGWMKGTVKEKQSCLLKQCTARFG